MNRTRLWATLSALFFLVVLALNACGSATGLAGGTGASKAGSAAIGEAGEAGAPSTAGTGGSSKGGSAGSGGAIGSEGGAAGEGENSATLVSVAVTPSIARAAVGTKVALQATGTYSDNSTRDITASATWTSDNASLASVVAGVVTAVAPGTANISASLSGLTGSAKITIPSATVQALTVTPATATVAIQGTVPFNAVVTLSDATTEDITATAAWSSSSPTVASVSSAGIATGLSAGKSTIEAAVGSVTGSAALTVSSATLVSIAVTPTNPTLGIGVTTQFTATGSFSDGSVSDVSTSATFSSSATAVATIDASTHSAKTLSAGTSTITATLGMISGSTTITVSAATLTAIAVSPATSTLAINGSTALTATGTYSDNSSVDLTQSVTWQSSNTSVATASNGSGTQGSITGLSGGTATINATLGNVSGSATVTVTAAALVSITISPTDPSLPIGTTDALSAQGTYSDGSSVDVTTSVTWSSDTAKVATVGNATGSQGLVTAVAIGTSNVRATLGTINASVMVTVTSAKLVSITVAPADPTLPAGTSQALSATAKYSDASAVDVTATAVWSSSATNIATVSNASGSQGEVTALVRGTTTVTATLSGVAGSTTVTVSAPTLKQVVVSPIAGSVRVGQNLGYTATAIFSNNTQQALNQGVTWSSSNTAVATVRAGGMGGFGGGEAATGVAVGTTTITATYQGVVGSATLTVTSATVVQIEVTPTNPTLSVNATQAFVATAIYSDNTSQDVTAQATWVSSDPAVAAVSTGGGGGGPGGGGPGARGTVTALAAGSSTISATLNGMTGSSTVTVSAATLVSISLTPTQPTVALGTQFAFTATAIYSDNSSQNVSARATWISSTPAVASVSTANGSRGQTLALTSGSTTISATFQGVTGTTLLTVTAATLTSIQVTPFSPTLPIGFNTNLAATGIYSDNTTRDLTAQVSWTSSAPNIAAVSDAAGSRGLLAPLVAGGATITATYQGVSGTDSITVSAATLSSIKVTPATATVSVHGTQAFTATGTLSDATAIDLTNLVTWSSTSVVVAGISNANGSRGVATGLATGQVTISAIRGALSGTATLTVQ
jgi:uncharacterized protein YjdB